MLGSNNYLGLTGDPRVKQAARDALERYGTGLTGSRLLNGTTPLHLELERELAEWMRHRGRDRLHHRLPGERRRRSGRCSGRATRSSATPATTPRSSTAASSPGPSCAPSATTAWTSSSGCSSGPPTTAAAVLVVVDGVFSMEGDVCDLPAIVELCERYGARLMVDEAHGGRRARRARRRHLRAVRPRGPVDLRMGTFSKSLASCGGFIAGPAEVVEYLRISSRPFIFTAAAVPAAVGAALGALRVIRAEGPELFGAAARQRRATCARGSRDLGLAGGRAGDAPRRHRGRRRRSSR